MVMSLSLLLLCTFDVCCVCVLLLLLTFSSYFFSSSLSQFTISDELPIGVKSLENKSTLRAEVKALLLLLRLR